MGRLKIGLGLGHKMFFFRNIDEIEKFKELERKIRIGY